MRSHHRHQEFLDFLRQIDTSVPAELDLHLIVDNYVTHKHAKVNAWLAKHPRFHLHFTPTADATPFRWSATADSILHKIERIAKRTSATGH